MAEGLAVVGVIANIIQLVDFSTKVISRIREFHSDVGEVPKPLRHINAELPVLQATLQQVGESIKSNPVNDSTEDAIVSVIQGCREQIQKLDTIIAKILPETSDSNIKKHWKSVKSVGQDDKVQNITKIIRNYVTTLTFYYTVLSSKFQPLTDKTMSKVRKWLSAPDPSVNYQKAQKQRQEDTGLWFLKGNHYTAWKTDPGSYLWLHGIPGCGKTILSSTILEDLLHHYANDPGKVVAYFYFDFNDVDKQDPEKMLRSLICQLSQQCGKIPTRLNELLCSCNDGNRQPSLLALKDVAKQIIQEIPQVYLILDALDECREREELMDMLELMAGWQLQNLHVLLTSRKERDIETSLATFIVPEKFVCLQSDIVNGDIQKYILQRLSDDKSLNKWQKDATIRQEIENTLIKGAHGMFRWAVCQLDTLGKCRNRAMLRKSLATLPPTLDTTYDRILCAISEEDSKLVIRILQWLAFSIRPLSVDEVAELVAIDTEKTPAFDKDEILEDPLEALDICSSLVTINIIPATHFENEKLLLTLAHYSVKEYIVSKRIRQGPAAYYAMHDISCHKNIALGSIGYLLQFKGSDMLSEHNVQCFRLAYYCATYWFEHAKNVSGEPEDLCERIMDFFSETDSYLNWLRLCDPSDTWGLFDFNKSLTSFPTPLYYAAFLGLTIVSQRLLDRNDNINAVGGRFGNALQAASLNGHEATVRLLIERGADINIKGGECDNAIRAASSNGHEAIVRLLIENGANVNAQSDSEYGNALEAASFKGHEAIVGLLLENGANVNAQSGSEYRNALDAASYKGHEAIVRLLLKYGANINAQSGSEYRNALKAASYAGHEAVVRLLLENGANINAQNDVPYKNALWVASYAGHEAVVRLLLENGANINAQNDVPYKNALWVASYHGHETVVRLLLEKGVEHGNALHGAAERKHEIIVHLLIEKGADVNAHSGYWGSPLQAASCAGSEAIIRLLLEKGAKVNAEGGVYGNALQAAAQKGHKAIIKLLLDRNADVHAVDLKFGSALHSLARRGQKDLIQMIYEEYQGNINLVDPHGRTLLHVAASHGHLDLLKYLVNLGLDLHAVDRKEDGLLSYTASGDSLEAAKFVLGTGIALASPTNHWSPLHWACRGSGIDMIELLLERGVSGNPVHIPGSTIGWSPASIAIYHGRKEELEYLSQPYKDLLKLEEVDPQIRVRNYTYKGCSGCYNDIYGTTFHCDTCSHIDYCFMCKPFLSHLHKNHEWLEESR